MSLPRNRRILVEDGYHVPCPPSFLQVVSRTDQGFFFIGSIVDMNVFRTLLHESYPALMTHFESIGFDISFIAGPWFLCFYISHVPWEVVLRITDYFFIEGPNIFIQVGLAAFHLCEKDLIQKKCIVETIEYLNNVKFDTEELCTLAFKTLKMDNRNMSYLRNAEKVKCLEGHFHQTNRNIFLHLKQKTKFPVELVQKLHNEWKRHLPVGSMNSCLNRFEFERLVLNCEPSREEISNYPNLLTLFDKKNVSFWWCWAFHSPLFPFLLLLFFPPHGYLEPRSRRSNLASFVKLSLLRSASRGAP